MRILLLLLLLSPLSHADEVYLTAGYSHLSAIQTGFPLNNKEETAYDAPFIGIEYYKTNWDLTFETELIHIFQDDELTGNNPRINFRVTKRVRIFQ